MAQRLTTATCLAAAISASLGSASVAAMSPSPLSLIGALLPTQDEESDVDAGDDEFVDDAGDDEAMAETEDTSTDAEDVRADEAVDEEAAAEPEQSEEVSQDEPEAQSEQESPDTALPDDAAEPPAAPEPPPPPDPPAPPATLPAPVPVPPEGRSAGTGDEREDTTIYKVVVNHEEQYSIWPANRENPLGWSDAGKSGNKQECLDYIKEVWTDMRPISLRKKMEEMERQRQNGGQ